MRYNVLAVLATPLLPILLTLDYRQIFSFFPNSALDSIVGAIVGIVVVGFFLYLPMTVIGFLPIHLVLRRYKRRNAFLYCAIFVPVGMVFQLYQTGGYLGSASLFLGNVALIAIAAITFWLIAVLLPELRAHSNSTPHTDAPPAGGAPVS